MMDENFLNINPRTADLSKKFGHRDWLVPQGGRTKNEERKGIPGHTRVSALANRRVTSASEY
jgi:hypothetical protein